MEEIRNRQLHEEPCFQKQHLGLLYSQSGEVSGEELLPKVTSIHWLQREPEEVGETDFKLVSN